MKTKEAIRLLHPDTTAEAIAEIEYKHGFQGKQAAINKINKACELACKALEKQIPKKPEYYGNGYSGGKLVYDYAKCPVCGRNDFEYDINNWGCKYCPDCGQALDWSDNE